MGAEARSIDASIAWHTSILRPENLAAELAVARDVAGHRLTALRRAIRNVSQNPPPLKRWQTYRDRRVYTSSIDHLESALGLAVKRFDDVAVGIGTFSLARSKGRLESSTVLAELAETPGPFDAYFEAELIPELARTKPTHIGVSLTFQPQAPAAFRLAALLAARLPHVVRVLGGPLVECWSAVGVSFDRSPFDLFDQVLAGSDDDMAQLIGGNCGGNWVASAGARGALAVALEEAPWADYMAPLPIVPVALGRGCYWRRCTFCPDYLHPRHRPCGSEALSVWLHTVASHFPRGAMLHLTDSALPPAYLEQIAVVIAQDRLPLQWHGFVRVERDLARPDFARLLAAGGCAMLQLGVESGAPALLEMMGKGAGPDLAKRVLRATAAAGIRNQVHLLFGLPGETDPERELTLGLIEEISEAVHAIHPALLNLPRRSPMHTQPDRFGITELVAFHADTDLSLYDDFWCGDSHPRTEARRWLDHRFAKSPAVRAIRAHLRTPFQANHLCFL